MFKDIKKGDLVLVNAVVKTTYTDIGTFRVKAVVERITAKRFIVNGESYNKDGGYMVGRANSGSFKALAYDSALDKTEEFKACKVELRTVVTALGVVKKALEDLQYTNKNSVEVLEQAKKLLAAVNKGEKR